jgi:hypothetical protein
MKANFPKPGRDSVQDLAPPMTAANPPTDPTGDAAIAKAAAVAARGTRMSPPPGSAAPPSNMVPPPPRKRSGR